MPILTALMLIGMGCAAKAPSLSPTSAPQPQSVHVHTLTVELKSGVTTVDLYYLATAQARPLVVVAHLVSSPPAGLEVDRERVGLTGFSAGGLATILAAADNPDVRVWIGLDPVGRMKQGRELFFPIPRPFGKP